MKNTLIINVPDDDTALEVAFNQLATFFINKHKICTFEEFIETLSLRLISELFKNCTDQDFIFEFSDNLFTFIREKLIKLTMKNVIDDDSPISFHFPETEHTIN